MTVKQLTYKRTVQVRQFEPITLEAIAEPDPDEPLDAAWRDLVSDIDEFITTHAQILRNTRPPGSTPRRDEGAEFFGLGSAGASTGC
jgi:hypothetical protein